MRQQFPFYNELQTIFTTRMQRMLWLEAEGSGSAATTSKKKAAAQFSSDEEDENEESDGEKGGGSVPKKKRKVLKGGNTANPNSNSNSNSNSVVAGVREMMEEFMKQQMHIEMQWMKAYEAREEERRVKEMEWRQTMEALENERMMMEKRWREREEQRRMREEARAEKRDALITALLNKLRREDNM